jgi:hypothetical protein
VRKGWQTNILGTAGSGIKLKVASIHIEIYQTTRKLDLQALFFGSGDEKQHLPGDS